MLKAFSQDQQLLKLLSEGSASESRKALSLLYEKYSKDIYQFLMYYSRNDVQLSKDILQDVFLKIYEKAQQYDNSKPFKPWAIQIASNLCKNKYKRRGLEDQFANKLNPDLSITHIQEKSDRAKTINGEIRQLPWNYREVIILKYKLKLSLEEMSQVLKIPVGTVKSRIYYASKALSEIEKLRSLKA